MDIKEKLYMSLFYLVISVTLVGVFMNFDIGTLIAMGGTTLEEKLQEIYNLQFLTLIVIIVNGWRTE
jgi:hypothetical protein